MTKEELIDFIRKHDSFFNDTPLENYSHEELLLMKISIDLEKENFKNATSKRISHLRIKKDESVF